MSAMTPAMTIQFFASVIKSGEAWSPACQQAMDEAMTHLAQPAQSVNVEAIRKVIAGLVTNAGDLDRIDMLPTLARLPSLARHLRNSADKLTAALQERGNGPDRVLNGETP